MPRTIPNIIVAAGILLAACSLGTGEESVPPTHYIRVTGTVHDSTGAPLSRISVQMGPDTVFSLARRTTDDEGKFTLTSDATFVPADSAPDSAAVALKFYPSDGRFRDSLLLTVPVKLRVTPINEPADAAVLNVELDLPH